MQYMQNMTYMTCVLMNDVYASYETYAIICNDMKNMHEIAKSVPASLLGRLQVHITAPLRVRIQPRLKPGSPPCVPQSMLLERGGVLHVREHCMHE